MDKDNKKLGYTKVPNSILWNKNLTLSEKGLLAILLSNKSDWHISITEIYSRSEKGSDSQRKIFQSICKKGYAVSRKYTERSSKRIKWEHKVFPEGDALTRKNPPLPFPEMETPKAETTQTETLPVEAPPVETGGVNNTIGNNTNKEITKENKMDELDFFNKENKTNSSNSLEEKQT